MIDLWVVALILSLGATWLLSFRALNKKRLALQPEHRNKQLEKSAHERAKRIDIESRMVCKECDHPVDPSTGVFESDAWWHEVCYRKMLKSVV